MDEVNLNELFGIVPEAAEGPAPEGGEGEKEQETAEPAAEAEEPEGAKEEDIAAPQQSKEENAAYAAARRRAEAESEGKIRKAREEAEAYVDGVIRDMKLVNPYTQQPIRTKKEYEEYRKGFHDDTGRSIREKRE